MVAVPTTGLLDAERLRMMKPSAWLINVARGAVVDEPALLSALWSAGVGPAGAVLDVFATEPLPPDSALWGLCDGAVGARLGAVGDGERHHHAA